MLIITCPVWRYTVVDRAGNSDDAASHNVRDPINASAPHAGCTPENMTSLISSLNGQYKSCGVGQPFSLQLQCNGPNCGAVLQFPGLQCQTVSGGQSCTNGVTCNPASNPQPSSSSGSGPPAPPSLGSGGFTSSFNIEQDQQTGGTVTNQNINIQGQSITLNATSNGTATYQYGDITVSNNGTTSPSPSSPGKSSSSKTYPLSNLFLIALVFFSMFVSQIHAQSVTWDDILQGLPQENVQFIESLEPELCAGTIPVINAAVCGGHQSFLGVADIARLCLQTVGQAPQPADVTGDNASQLIFSLGNTIACDQIANAMLSDSQGLTGRGLCSAYVPFSTCTTSVFTTEFTSSGMILVSTLSTLGQSSAASSGSAATETSAGSASSGASPAVNPSSGTVTSTAASQGSTPNAMSTSASAGVVSSGAPVSNPAVGSSSSPLTSAASNTTLAIKHRRFGGIPCDDERL